MRRAAALVALLLAACATPSGATVESCGVDWLDVEPAIVDVAADGATAEAIPIECIRTIGERRIRIGFELPPGPDCHVLASVELVESADAVSVVLLAARSEDPLAGACAPRAVRRITEVDLQAPIGERTLLDGSRP